jgi:hypothetical protein
MPAGSECGCGPLNRAVQRARQARKEWLHFDRSELGRAAAGPATTLAYCPADTTGLDSRCACVVLTEDQLSSKEWLGFGER